MQTNEMRAILKITRLILDKIAGIQYKNHNPKNNCKCEKCLILNELKHFIANQLTKEL